MKFRTLSSLIFVRSAVAASKVGRVNESIENLSSRDHHANECEDSPLTFQGMLCSEIDANETSQCDNIEISSHCPVTCGSCSEFECSDSLIDWTYFHNNIIRNCEDAEDFSQDLINFYCNNRIGINETCRETCQICPSPYPLKLKAPDGEEGDEFGWSAAIYEDLVLIGAHKHGANGIHSGAAYLFRTDGTFIRKFLSPEGIQFEYFGDKVALYGDAVLINAEGNGEFGVNSGAVYHFNTNGTFIKKVTAFDAFTLDNFGQDVSKYGNITVISADGDRDNGLFSGSIYLYDEESSFISKIVPDDGDDQDRFGKSFEIYEETIVVGSYRDEPNGYQSGSAYLYDTNSTFLGKIIPEDGNPDERFGKSSSIYEEVMAFGADGRFSCQNQEVILPYMMGSAYLYNKNQTLITKLNPYDGEGCDLFGWSVALNENFLLVGSPNHGLVLQKSGAVYVYELDGTFVSKIEYPSLAAIDNFGVCISINGDLAVIGASGDDENGTNSGAAYIVDLNEF